MKRLNMDAETATEMMEYIFTRSRQLLSRGYSLESIEFSSQPYSHVTAFLSQNGERFKTVYLAKSARGAGNYKEWHKRTGDDIPVITIPDCNIAGYLGFNDIKHVLVTGPYDTRAYKAIEQYYGDRKPKRANVWLMNHIDEGLAVLNAIGASPLAYETFCLHPLVQNDNDLKANIDVLDDKLHNWVGAMEYRSVANEYLSRRDINSPADIRLSPLSYVNEALIADKVQNYKDFMLHHAEHPHYARLFNYFHNWFEALGLDCKKILDLLSLLYDNDDMNAVNKNIPVNRIPVILTTTRIECERRRNLPA